MKPSNFYAEGKGGVATAGGRISQLPRDEFSFSKVNQPDVFFGSTRECSCSLFSKPCNMHRAFPSTCLILA
jgi:hypothetical protein